MNYLSFVSDDVHTAIVATVDNQGRPVTAAIDKLHCVVCGNCYRVCPTGAVSKLSPE